MLYLTVEVRKTSSQRTQKKKPETCLSDGVFNNRTKDSTLDRQLKVRVVRFDSYLTLQRETQK